MSCKTKQNVNQCLYFSSLTNDFAAVKAQRYLFQIFNHILNNKKQKVLQTLVSIEAPPVVVQYKALGGR